MSTYTLKKIEVIPEGYYPVTISKVEEVTGEFGQQERFTLSLPGNRELLAWASASYTTKSKLYKWVRAVLFSGGLTRRLHPGYPAFHRQAGHCPYHRGDQYQG